MIKSNLFKGIIFLSSFILFFVFVKCEKDSKSRRNSSGNYTVSGKVIDGDNNPMANVYIEAYGSTASSETDGKFTLKIKASVPARVVVNFQKEGYYDAVVGTPKNESQSEMKVAMRQKTLLGTINSNTGGQIDNNDIKFDFQPDAFIGTDGSIVNEPVNIYADFIDPDVSNFSESMPGGDFIGEDNVNGEGILESYGAILMDASTTSGKKVQANKLFTIKMRIPDSKIASAPSEMSTWVLNTQGVWEELGIAGNYDNYYTYYSDQIAATNCDRWMRNGTITGTICIDGEPTANVEVRVNQLLTLSNSNGNYKLVVPANELITITTAYATTSTQVSPGETKSVNIGCSGGNASTGSYSFKLGETNYSGTQIQFDEPLNWTDCNKNNRLSVWSESDNFTLIIDNIPSSGNDTYTYVFGDNLTCESTYFNEPFIQFAKVSSADMWVSSSGTITRVNDYTIQIDATVKNPLYGLDESVTTEFKSFTGTFSW